MNVKSNSGVAHSSTDLGLLLLGLSMFLTRLVMDVNVVVGVVRVLLAWSPSSGLFVLVLVFGDCLSFFLFFFLFFLLLASVSVDVGGSGVAHSGVMGCCGSGSGWTLDVVCAGLDVSDVDEDGVARLQL